MKTRLVATLLALALAIPSSGDDTGAASAYKKLYDELMSKSRTVTAPDARAQLLAEYSQKFLDHAVKYPKDQSAVDALCDVIRITRPGAGPGTPRGKAIELLKKQHVKGTAIRKQLKRLAVRPDAVDAFEVVQAVLKENPDRTTRAWACRALIAGYESRVALADRLEKDDAFREGYEKERGKEAAGRLIDGAPNSRLRLRQQKKALQTKYAGVFPDLSIGKEAPELVCEDLDGKKVKLSELRGKVVVLDFWTTWCGFCIKMIPHERELVKRLKDKPFVLVSISADDSKEKVKSFQQRTPMPWTHWYIGDRSEVLDTWNIEGFPTILVLDHKGVIRYKDVRDTKMDEAVDTLLKEMGE
jgi:thiol-disulfide isomerase/thioredoxin